MKFTFPGIVLTAFLAASPAALAQNTNYIGSTSKPGASFQKDDTTTSVTKTSKKHMVSHKKTSCQGHGLEGHEVQGAINGLWQFLCARSEL